ncbi:MAG: aminoacyl-tRNA hydrolase [Candidatus Saccharimonadales bacterium]
MSLFERKTEFGNAKPMYTLGLDKTLLIVGLGNIGKEYDDTRHNVGFACVDALANSQGIDVWSNKKDLKSFVAMGKIGDTRVVFCKPTTLMNLSGDAVQAVSNFYKIVPSDIVVIHDDIDIDFGQIRTRVGGGSAGHNGIKSISQQLGEDYGRVRVGIGPKLPEQIDSADFVLAKFSKSEQTKIPQLLKESTAILTEIIHGQKVPTETRSFII